MHCSMNVCYSCAHVDDVHPCTHSTSNPMQAWLRCFLVRRLIVQTALQPGVASVYREIVRQGPDAVQFKWCHVDRQLAGAYGQLQRHFADAVLCGVLSGTDATLQLNPDDDVEVHEGDKIIGLTRQGMWVVAWPDK